LICGNELLKPIAPMITPPWKIDLDLTFALAKPQLL